MTQKQLNVDLTKINNTKCKCGSIFWDNTNLIKKVPGLLVGSSQETIANVSILLCHSCGEVFPEHEILTKSPVIKIG